MEFLSHVRMPFLYEIPTIIQQDNFDKKKNNN